jgi:hypothetical protein
MYYDTRNRIHLNYQPLRHSLTGLTKAMMWSQSNYPLGIRL